MSDDLQSTLAQPVVLIVAQSLRRCNHNGLTCVDTHWVEILHVADSDAVVVLVPHHFVLEFFPTLPVTRPRSD
jgi:broad-specificity NMP kinase